MAASAPHDSRKGSASLMKKAGGAVKKIIGSKTRTGEVADEPWEFLAHEKEEHKTAADKDEDVFSIILREKTELQTKNTQLLKKLADMERKLKESESQTAKKERELHHLQKQEQRGQRPGFQRQDSYEKAITSGQGSTVNKDQEIRSLKRQIDHLRWEDEQHIFEISSHTEEIRQLKENIEQLRSLKSAAETEIVNISEHAKHLEIQYHTEREHGQRLQDQIGQLQQQLEVTPLPEQDDKASSGEENSAKIIARLQCRIKMLNDNVSKLQEHSVEQSRTVLHLKQQAEMSQHMEEQVRSLEGLLEDAEKERDRLHKVLSEKGTHVDDHRTIKQDDSGSLAGLQAKSKDKESKLADEIKELKDKLAQAEAQVLVYKADFEEERRDRERVHGLIDDIKKKGMQVEGRAAQERVGYKQELDNVQQDLKYTKEQLHKVRDEAEAARGEANKYFKEAETFRESTKFWRDQAEASQRDVQAKASQVKQYAKELGKLKTKVEEHKKQQNASKESMKILMEMHDKVIKEKDQLKKQYDQLLKQNEQLKKKRKGSTDKLLASPDPPPEEDSTLLAIEFAHQRADDADKRAEEARARVIEAERRAKEAEKYARAAHTGAESRVTKLEKQVDEERVVVQRMSSEIQRLNHENEQLRRQLGQPNSKSSSQLANMTWPVSEDAQTAGSGSFANSQPLRASVPQEPAPQGELKPGVTTVTTGKPPPSHQLHLQNTSARPQSQKIAAISPMTPPSGHSAGGHPISGPAGLVPTNPEESTEQSTGHSERVIGAKELHGQRRPLSFPQNAPSSTTTAVDPKLLRRALHESQPQLHQGQSHTSNLPHRGSKEIISPTMGSPQHLARQGIQSQVKKQPPPTINAASSDSEGDTQPGDDDEYGNELQRGVDHDIHKQAAAVIREVSGDRHRIKTDVQRPYDPNLMCPMCMKKFRIGEIQKFKRHVNTCDGTDDDIGAGAIDDDSDLI